VTFLESGDRGLPSKQKSKPAKPVKLRWDRSRTVAENARVKLPELARAYFAAGRQLETGTPSFKQFHRFRLLTKHLRYTLELFRPCYGPGLELRIEALRTVQTDLGEINDCATTRELLLKRGDLKPAQRDWLVGNLQMLADARIAKFRAHWRDELSPPEKERGWVNYLERYAMPRRK
jgi:CHAD domain-containing protein